MNLSLETPLRILLAGCLLLFAGILAAAEERMSRLLDSLGAIEGTRIELIGETPSPGGEPGDSPP